MQHLTRLLRDGSLNHVTTPSRDAKYWRAVTCANGNHSHCDDTTHQGKRAVSYKKSEPRA